MLHLLGTVLMPHDVHLCCSNSPDAAPSTDSPDAAPPRDSPDASRRSLML